MSVCLLRRRKWSMKPCRRVHLRRKSEVPSPHGFFCPYELKCVCLSRTDRERRAGLFSTLLCDWWFAVFVDELTEASLLRLAEGLIHHSPVQVCRRHYSHFSSVNSLYPFISCSLRLKPVTHKYCILYGLSETHLKKALQLIIVCQKVSDLKSLYLQWCLTVVHQS